MSSSSETSPRDTNTPTDGRAAAKGEDPEGPDTRAVFPDQPDVSDMIAGGYQYDAGIEILGPQEPLGMADLPKRRPGRPRGRRSSKISISLKTEQLAALDAIVARDHTTRSEVIGTLVSEHLEERTVGR